MKYETTLFPDHWPKKDIPMTIASRYRAALVLTSSRKSHHGFSFRVSAFTSIISRYWSWQIGESGFPSPWYLAKIARASSARSLAISHLGDSGKNIIRTMTTLGSAAWTMVGIRQAQALSMFLAAVSVSQLHGRSPIWYSQVRPICYPAGKNIAQPPEVICVTIRLSDPFTRRVQDMAYYTSQP